MLYADAETTCLSGIGMQWALQSDWYRKNCFLANSETWARFDSVKLPSFYTGEDDINPEDIGVAAGNEPGEAPGNDDAADNDEAYPESIRSAIFDRGFDTKEELRLRGEYLENSNIPGRPKQITEATEQSVIESATKDRSGREKSSEV